MVDKRGQLEQLQQLTPLQTIALLTLALVLIGTVAYLFRPPVTGPGGVTVSPTPTTTGFQAFSRTFSSPPVSDAENGVTIEIQKTVSVTLDKYSDSVTFNNKGSATTFIMLEVIPKSIASSVSQLRFTTTGVGDQNVIQADPIIEYRWTVASGGSFTHSVTGPSPGTDTAIIRVLVLRDLTEEQVNDLARLLQPLQTLDINSSLANQIELELTRLMNEPPSNANADFQTKLLRISDYMKTVTATAPSATITQPAVSRIALYSALDFENASSPRVIFAQMQSVEFNPVKRFSFTTPASMGEPLLRQASGGLSSFVTATRAKQADGSWLVNVTIAYPQRMTGGVLSATGNATQVQALTGSLDVGFAREPSRPRTVNITIIATHERPGLFLYVVPKTVEQEIDENGNAGNIRKPLFLVNNYPFNAFELELAGSGLTANAGEVKAFYAPREPGYYTLSQNGQAVLFNDILVDGGVSLEQTGGRLVSDLSSENKAVNYRICSNSACDCQQVNDALDSFLQEFDENLGKIQDLAEYKQQFGTNEYSQRIILFTQTMDQCSLYPPFNNLQLRNRGVHAIKLTANIETAPFVFITSNEQSIISSDAALQSVLKQPNLAASTQGVKSLP
ncbi:MAG TPA: hypothetical protein VGQ00_00080 [Candidatus Norongarragalinales archaeon]|jgi:hypothetical protein|nr:hypothetical protein [Candidatus Norongarragalinales archaeon]